ncbi:MAG TPA: TerB family tellurite resistance protein [Rhodanobacteraceae bacterium]|nr:TerB family tellurite resistance protein [Rhodanobacteraceae bacterium]
MLDRLAASVGELLHGGAVTPQQEVLVETLFGLMGHLAGTDSIVTSEEAAFANALMQELDLPAYAAELAREAFQAGRRRELDVDTRVQAFVAIYPAGSDTAARLFEAVLHLAVADQRMRPGERLFLEQVGARLGFDRDALDRRLAAMQETS